MSDDEVKFEKALDQLEKIVSDLESGDLSLDEALKKYEEGVKLSRICNKKLGEAEKKIEILTKSLNDTISASDSDEEPKKSGTRKTKKTSKDTETDFLV